MSESLTRPPSDDPARRFQRSFLLLLLAGITLLFVQMVRELLLTVFLAAIFAGLCQPLYARLRRALGGRAAMASVATILLLLVGIVLPLSGFLGLVVAESVTLSERVAEWIRNEPDRVGQLRALAERYPVLERLLPPDDVLVAKAAELARNVGPILAGKLAAVGTATASFLFQLFVCLYAMFFFLVDGRTILRQALFYLPLGPVQEAQLLERFLSVTRATLKGSILIGVIQGLLAGVAFAVAGVPGAAFWGTVMVVFSLVPAVGAALIWIPAVIYLVVSGHAGAGLGLLAWCMLVVSSVDNFLRPMLVGRDAQMSDLMILLGTVGGITYFGALGFIVGPVVAALFVTAWHIYGSAFRDWLPAVPEALLDAHDPDDDPPPGGATATDR